MHQILITESNLFKNKQSPIYESLRKCKQMLQDSDEDMKLEGLLILKRVINDALKEKNELDKLITKCIDFGLLSTITDMLQNKNLDLLNDCLWILINTFCCNSQIIDQLVKIDGLDYLVDVLDMMPWNDEPSKQRVSVANKSIWALGNVVSSSPKRRDRCLEKHICSKIISVMKMFPDEIELLERSIWTFTRLVANYPPPDWEQISELLPIFVSILQGNLSEKSIRDALLGIYYLSKTFVVKVAESGCISIVFNYFQASDISLSFLSLNILGNILSSDFDEFTDEVLKNDGFLPRLFDLCMCEDETIQVYALWNVNNIAAGTSDQKEKLLAKKKYLQILGDLLESKNEKIKYHASCAMANLVFRANSDQIYELADMHKYLDYLSFLLEENTIRVYERNVIEPIHRLLKDDPEKKMISLLKSKGIIDRLKVVSGNLSYEMKGLAEEVIRESLLHKTDDISVVENLQDNVQIPNSNELIPFGIENHAVTVNVDAYADQSDVENAMVTESINQQEVIPPITSNEVISQMEVVAISSIIQSSADDVLQVTINQEIKENKIMERKETLKRKRPKVRGQHLRFARKVSIQSIYGGRVNYTIRKKMEKESNKRIHIKRTNSIQQVIEEAQSWIQEVVGKTRSKGKIVEKVVIDLDREMFVIDERKESKLLVNSKKILKVTNYKQTLMEKYFK